MMRGPPPANRRVRALSLEQLSPEKLPLLEKERRRKKQMRIGQADVGKRIVRILCNRLIVILDGFAQVRTGPLLGKEVSFEIKLVRFRIHRRCFCNSVSLSR